MSFDDFWQDLKRLRAARGRRAANLIAWRRAPSSHRTARRLIDEYCSEEALPPSIDIVAFEQTAGHGREGRAWSSPPAAGLYASLVRPLCPGAMPALATLVPVTLAEALSGPSGGRCRIKWPNDLVADGAKLGGVLIDARSQGGRHAAVISFGVNVTAELGVFAQDRATSLGALGVAPSLASLFEDLIEALDRALSTCEAGPPEDLVGRYRRLSAHADGQGLRWSQGGRIVEGTFRGFEADGRLRLEVDGQLELVSAGSLLESGDDGDV